MSYVGTQIRCLTSVIDRYTFVQRKYENVVRTLSQEKHGK